MSSSENIHKENTSIHWTELSSLPAQGYWFGQRYGGLLGNRLLVNQPAIEAISKNHFFPPLVLANEIWYPGRDGQNAAQVRVAPLDTEWLNYPVGWAIVVRENKIMQDLKIRNSRDLTTEESQKYATQLNSLFKRALLTIAAYEYLDLRMHLNDPYWDMVSRFFKQGLAAGGALLATEGGRDLASKSFLGLAAMAIIQNYMSFGQDYAHYSNEDTLEGSVITGRNISELWRHETFPQEFERTSFGPGVIPNTIIRSLPFSELLEPIYRSLGTLPQFKQDLIAIK